MNNEAYKNAMDIVNFYRDEVKFEFSLLGQRLAWYVTCQSFLLTSFTISFNNKFSSTNWLQYVIISIGLLTSILIWPAVDGAHKTIKMYMRKKREFLKENDSELKCLKIPRDYYSIEEDGIHASSMCFSWIMPLLFIIIWIIIFTLNIIFPLK